MLLIDRESPGPSTPSLASAPRPVPAPAADERSLRTRNLRARETLYRPGDPPLFVYEVARGSLMIHATLDDGRRQIVDFIRQGELCGFAAGAEYDATCIACEPTTVVCRERAALWASPEQRNRFLKQVDRRVGALQDHALTLGRKNATERVASFLLRFASDAGPGSCARRAGDEDARTIVLPAKRGEIGDYLGLAIETVSRELTDLERSGLIQIGPGRSEIRINDLCRLCRAAKGDVCAGR